MLPPKETMCHRTGFAKSCRECVTEHNCQLWMRVTGIDPNTGEHRDYYACADVLLIKMQMECAKESRQTAAAVESFRNEMIKRNDLALRLQAGLDPVAAIEGPSEGSKL